MKIWMGWLKRESGSAGFRQTNGDNGNAYGLMQFDRRYALVPFMQYCVDYSDRYEAFKPYIAYGAGSDKLKSNGALAVVWTYFCDHFPEEFEQLQIAYGYQYYYLEAEKYMQRLHGIVMDNHGPAVKGTLWSMAIRSGALCAARKFAGCADYYEDELMLNVAYRTYGNEDAKRWTKAGQWGDALAALLNDEYTDIMTELNSIEGSVDMSYKIINAVSSKNVPQWGNKKKYIAIHYLGVVGQNHDLAADGCGAHYYIYWDGTIYQRCSHDAVVWQVGTAGYYKQKHATARNANTIGIELCCKCDGDKSSAEDKKWYFTEETQKAAVWLVKKLMKDENIPAANVLRHYDIVNKTCPAPYVHNNKYKTSWTWDEFKKKLSGSAAAAPAAKKYYRVGTGWSGGKCQNQSGAYESLTNAKKAAEEARDANKKTYYVFDDDGKTVHTAKYEAAAKYVVQSGAYRSRTNAENRMARIKKAGFDAVLKYEDGFFRIQCGAFSKKGNATALVEKLKKAGFDAIIK